MKRVEWTELVYYHTGLGRYMKRYELFKDGILQGRYDSFNDLRAARDKLLHEINQSRKPELIKELKEQKQLLKKAQTPFQKDRIRSRIRKIKKKLAGELY